MNIVDGLSGLITGIDDAQLDPKNARQHNEKNMRAIKASLRRFGQRKPIVVNRTTGFIEAGNGTWQAAKDMGWEKLAMLFVDDDHTTATGYAIADNRTAELADWDYSTLSELVHEHSFDIPVDDLGFTQKEIDNLVKDSWDEDPIDGVGGNQINDDEDEDDEEPLFGGGNERFVQFTEDQWDVVIEASAENDLADFLTELCREFMKEED